nr:double-cubane-cluster-containing anaerobic reductase [Eggerthella sinensis]
MVDVGGQDTKVIVLRGGKVAKFAMNDKCSAGTGKFLEIMANRLGVSQEELARLARTGAPTSISSMCTVFAESEVISLIGKGTPREDIAYGVIESVVGKVSVLARQGKGAPYFLTGGLCENDYFIERLGARLGAAVSTSPERASPAPSARRCWRPRSGNGGMHDGAHVAALVRGLQRGAQAGVSGGEGVQGARRQAGGMPVLVHAARGDRRGRHGRHRPVRHERRGHPRCRDRAAEEPLPAHQGTYGFALTEKCPYTYFSDLIVGETTCDGKKKMYELLADLKDVHVLHLPQSQARSWAADIWYEEVKLLVQELERRFDVSITDEKLRDAVRLRNRYRRALVRLYELQRSEPPAMRGVELMSTLLASTFSFDVETFVAQLEALGDERARAYAEGERPVPASAKRIMLTGCPSGGVINKVGKAIEDNGGVVVCLDDCSGERTNRLMVDEDADDILRAIADRYLAINCSVMTPNEGRLDNAAAMARAYRVDGVVEVVLQACHTFNVEAEHVRRRMEAEGIPYLKLETDYSQGDTGQVETRLGAFLEMV